MMIMMWLLGCFDKDMEEDIVDTSSDQEAVCDEIASIECEDSLFLDLSLQDAISDGDVISTTDGDDFLISVDATAGGYQQASSNPWVYIKFTESGAEKVDITDEEALESLVAQCNRDVSVVLVKDGKEIGEEAGLFLKKKSGGDFSKIIIGKFSQ